MFFLFFGCNFATDLVQLDLCREVMLEKQMTGHRVDRSICAWFWDYVLSQGGDPSKVKHAHFSMLDFRKIQSVGVWLIKNLVFLFLNSLEIHICHFNDGFLWQYYTFRWLDCSWTRFFLSSCSWYILIFILLFVLWLVRFYLWLHHRHIICSNSFVMESYSWHARRSRCHHLWVSRSALNSFFQLNVSQFIHCIFLYC